MTRTLSRNRVFDSNQTPTIIVHESVTRTAWTRSRMLNRCKLDHRTGLYSFPRTGQLHSVRRPSLGSIREETQQQKKKKNGTRTHLQCILLKVKEQIVLMLLHGENLVLFLGMNFHKDSLYRTSLV